MLYENLLDTKFTRLEAAGLAHMWFARHAGLNGEKIDPADIGDFSGADRCSSLPSQSRQEANVMATARCSGAGPATWWVWHLNSSIVSGAFRRRQ